MKLLIQETALSGYFLGFDIIDHPILPNEVRSLNINQTPFFWIRSFLTNQTQAVRVSSSLSSLKQVNGVVPQGAKLGLTLFAIMVNKLLMNWHMRTKYVDDTTAFEIIPRNSVSMLDVVVREIPRLLYWTQDETKSQKM